METGRTQEIKTDVQIPMASANYKKKRFGLIQYIPLNVIFSLAKYWTSFLTSVPKNLSNDKFIVKKSLYKTLYVCLGTICIYIIESVLSYMYLISDHPDELIHP